MSRKRTIEKVVDVVSSSAPNATDGSLTRYAEQKLAGHFHHVIGIDEAGRGPLAGPVVAAACWVRDGVQLSNIRDSKQTNEAQREKSYEEIMKIPSSDLLFGVSVIDHKEIDEINILQATMKAMRCACTDLLSKATGTSEAVERTPKGKSKKGVKRKSCEGTDGTITLAGTPLLTAETTTALIDGNRCPEDMPVEPKFVIKGDTFVYSISVASIIAKVTRDRIMLEMDRLYPAFNFAQHKGYPTLAHRTALVKHGPCPIHRLTYGPVARCIPTTAALTPTKSSGKAVKKTPLKLGKSVASVAQEPSPAPEAKTTPKSKAKSKIIGKSVDILPNESTPPIPTPTPTRSSKRLRVTN
mgnify:CR=1 FL=1